MTFWQRSYITAKGLQVIKMVAKKLHHNLRLESSNVTKKDFINLLVKSQLNGLANTFIDSQDTSA